MLNKELKRASRSQTNTEQSKHSLFCGNAEILCFFPGKLSEKIYLSGQNPTCPVLSKHLILKGTHDAWAFIQRFQYFRKGVIRGRSVVDLFT
jgi:hypothetical protein